MLFSFFQRKRADGIFFLLLQKENVCAPILFFLFSEKEKNRRLIRRRLLHYASAGAAKAPYPQSPSSFPNCDRSAGSQFGSGERPWIRQRMCLRPHSFLSLFGERKESPRPVKKRKETTREPFGRFSGLSRSTKGASPLDSAAYGMSEVYDDDSERRCAERRDLSGGRDGWDGQM